MNIVAIFIVSFLLFIIFIVGLFIWLRYKKILREAKNYERGLKMVPLLIHLPPSSSDTDVGQRDVRDVTEEVISKAQTLYDIIASTATKGFKSKLYGQRHISFEIVAAKGLVHYYAAVPVTLVPVVQQAVVSAYPTARLEEVSEHNIFSPIGKITGTIGGELELKEDYVKPIATYKESKRDTMQSLLNALGALGSEDGAGIQILLRPANDGWSKKSIEAVSKLKKEKGQKKGLFSAKEIAGSLWKPPETKETKPDDKQLSNLEQSQVDAIEDKTKHAAYETMIRVVASSNTAQKAQSILSNIVATFALYDAPGKNGFKYSEAKDIDSFVTAYIMRFFPQEIEKNILNSVELATLFHFPDESATPTSQLERQSFKQVDGPRNVPDNGTLLGYNVFRGVKKEIRMSDDDRVRHAYIVGQTGTGKSTLAENMAIQDMLAGKGFAYVDPHGDGVERLVNLVPKERTEDVIYFAPFDMDYPMGLNFFEHQTAQQKDFLIQEAINMLYKLYDPQRQGIIGPRYEHWFRNAALTLMADPQGSTFIDIPKVFTDDAYKDEKLKFVTDQTVLDFWNREMKQTADFHKSEVLGWFVSKFGAFMSNEMMRNIIGQTKSAFNLREIMDNKKILLVNLSKGRTGELNSKLLGMIFVMKFQAAAMSRADIPKEQRVPFTLYVDEFQNFSTDSFATILSEARKYNLNLIVLNQFIGQLTEEIRDAVFGNVGSIVTLRAGATDADFLVKQFAPVFDAEDIVKVPNHQAIVRLMISGIPSQPFSMETLPPLGKENVNLGNALKKLSAYKYGQPKAIVEKAIFERLRTKEPPAPKFGAPSGAPGAGPNRRPGAGGPAGAGGSSFLDDFLAKRRARMAQGGAPGVPGSATKPAGPLAPGVAPMPPAINRPQIQPPPSQQPLSAPQTPSSAPYAPIQPSIPPPSQQTAPASPASDLIKGHGGHMLGGPTSDTQVSLDDTGPLPAVPTTEKIIPPPATPPINLSNSMTSSRISNIPLDDNSASADPNNPNSIYIDKDGKVHYSDEDQDN